MNENYSFINKKKKKKKKCADYASSASFYKKERKSLVFSKLCKIVLAQSIKTWLKYTGSCNSFSSR